MTTLVEVLEQATAVGIVAEVVELATDLVMCGVDNFNAHLLAFNEILKDEVFRKGHSGQGEIGENGGEGSLSYL